MMSSVLQTKTNLIKNIDFVQFLNLISSLSELFTPNLYKRNPKSALKQILSRNLIPLLKQIESL